MRLHLSDDKHSMAGFVTLVTLTSGTKSSAQQILQQPWVHPVDSRQSPCGLLQAYCRLKRLSARDLQHELVPAPKFGGGIELDGHRPCDRLFSSQTIGCEGHFYSDDVMHNVRHNWPECYVIVVVKVPVSHGTITV